MQNKSLQKGKKAIESVTQSVNKAAGRTSTPHPRNRVYLETSGICNFGCRMCPYTEKEMEDKVVMTDEIFEKAVKDAVRGGWNQIKLCPSTGEVFTDKNIWDRLQFIDGSGIDEWVITSNWSMIEPEKTSRLYEFDNFQKLNISVYGFDLQSFKAVAQRPEKQYERLVKNLEALADVEAERDREFDIRLKWWIGDKERFENGTGPLVEAVERLHESVDEFNIRTIAENQGGEIDEEDVEDLDIEVRQEGRSPREGPCKELFDSSVVLPDGRVNACICADKAHTLVIGDVTEHSLDWLISAENPNFRDLFQQHEESEYPTACANCSRYKSIYRSNEGNTSLEGAKNIMGF